MYGLGCASHNERDSHVDQRLRHWGQLEAQLLLNLHIHDDARYKTATRSSEGNPTDATSDACS